MKDSTTEMGTPDGPTDPGSKPREPHRTGPDRSRPDPRPMRLVIAGVGVSALSVVVTGLIRLPVSGPQGPQLAGEVAPEVRVSSQVRYVQLKRGQAAPPGARVIEAAAPTPRVVVRIIDAPVPRAAPRVVARTRQSGRP